MGTLGAVRFLSSLLDKGIMPHLFIFRRTENMPRLPNTMTSVHFLSVYFFFGIYSFHFGGHPRTSCSQFLEAAKPPFIIHPKKKILGFIYCSFLACRSFSPPPSLSLRVCVCVPRSMGSHSRKATIARGFSCTLKKFYNVPEPPHQSFLSALRHPARKMAPPRG